MSPPDVDTASNPVDRGNLYNLNFCDGLRTAAFKKVWLDAVLALVGWRRVHGARKCVYISVRVCKFATPKIQSMYQIGQLSGVVESLAHPPFHPPPGFRRDYDI